MKKENKFWQNHQNFILKHIRDDNKLENFINLLHKVEEENLLPEELEIKKDHLEIVNLYDDFDVIE